MAVATKTRKTYVRSIAVISAEETLVRYQDSATVTAVGVTSSVNTRQSKDADRVIGRGEIISVDGFGLAHTSTVIGKGVISAAELRTTVDAATATGVGVAIGVEDRARLDAATITGVGVLSNTTQQFNGIDSATVRGKAIVMQIQEYVDASTAISRAHVTEILDVYIANDSATVTSVASAITNSNYLFSKDEATVVGNSGSGEFFPGDDLFPGDDMFPGEAGVSAVELFAGVDADRVIGVGSTGNTYYDGWVLAPDGVTLTADLTKRVVGVGVASGFENFVWNETGTVTGVGVLSAVLQYQKSIEFSTITGVTVIISDEIQIGSSTNILEGVGKVANQTGGTAWNPVVDERFQANRVGSPAMGRDISSTDFAEFTDTASPSMGRSTLGSKIKSIANAIDGYVDSFMVSGVTNASPPVVTATGHTFTNGQRVLISGVGGATGANGLFKIASVGANVFTLNTEAGGNPAAPGVYTSGGQVWNGFYPIMAVTAATNATPIQVTATAHSLVSGDIVKIVNGTGNTAVNGTWVVTFVDANNVTLNGSVGNGAYGASSANMAKMSGTPYAASTSDYAGAPLAQKYNAG